VLRGEEWGGIFLRGGFDSVGWELERMFGEASL